jgi:hypothetical protein
MTPKEKAEELVNEFYNYTMDVIILSKSLECSKQCALITINQMIEAVYDLDDDSVDYYREVKYEIEKL